MIDMRKPLLCVVLLSVSTFARGARQISVKKPSSPSLAFGFCSSRVTVNDRISDVAQWWDSRLSGVVLVDNEVPADLPALPAGLQVQAVSKPWQFVSAAERCAWGQVADMHAAYPKADWYVLGDDDTLFVPEALETVLSRYDSSKPWYMGSVSESPKQIHYFGVTALSTGSQLGSYAFGGGGIIISSGLMQRIIKDYQQCLHDHAGMFGGDQRIGACIKVLAPGTELTILKGMHQIDVVDHDCDLQAMLEAHAVQPLLSLHHMAEVPLPGLGNLNDLRNQIRRDPYGALQQSVCQSEQHGTFSVSAGLSVRWWDASIDINIADLTDPAKRATLPKVSKYFVYSKGLNSEGSPKSKTISSWYAVYDAFDSTSLTDTASVTKVLVQAPAGPQRWLSSQWDRLQCPGVMSNVADNSVHIVLGGSQTALA